MGRKYQNPPLEEAPFLQGVPDLLRSLAYQQVAVLQSREVERYLVRYPRLMPLLPEYAEAAREEFPDASIEVTVYRDPEEDEEYLVMYVRYNQYPAGILERVSKLRQQLRPRQRELLGVEEDAGLLFLTTDFQPPGTL